MIKARIALVTLMMILSGAAGMVVMSPANASAAADCSGRRGQYLLTFPAWYRGIVDDSCKIQPPGKGKNDMAIFIAKIALNVVEIILQLVAYTTVVFLIKGGFDYMLSQGEAQGMTGAKNTIMNAVIGLVISLLAVAIVNLIAGALAT